MTGRRVVLPPVPCDSAWLLTDRDCSKPETDRRDCWFGLPWNKHGSPWEVLPMELTEKGQPLLTACQFWGSFKADCFRQVPHGPESLQ